MPRPARTRDSQIQVTQPRIVPRKSFGPGFLLQPDAEVLPFGFHHLFDDVLRRLTRTDAADRFRPVHPLIPPSRLAGRRAALPATG